MGWIRQFPLRKSIALFFTLFACVLIGADQFSGYKLTGNGADVLKWLGTVIIPMYFIESGYEHGINQRGDS